MVIGINIHHPDEFDDDDEDCWEPGHKTRLRYLTAVRDKEKVVKLLITLYRWLRGQELFGHILMQEPELAEWYKKYKKSVFKQKVRRLERKSNKGKLKKKKSCQQAGQTSKKKSKKG